ncbi:tRNA uracil 4-sulfurtransferase ThiI [Halomonas halocynthiae]|uniref:tRNA uracil 4-sulfurtransferase ThiI n=1 Tax=Halomonas halocynthiae TaxID=176290 RepID=UPI0003FB7879|nr:tRNA uracil 4-sulfurtransferase ThiI [Halomonas halocynthiae]
MSYLLKFSPEIMIKSRPVRRNMSRHLASNIRTIVRRHDASARVKDAWDHLRLHRVTPSTTLTDMLTRIPGVHEVQRVDIQTYQSFEATRDLVVAYWADSLCGKQFRVSVKRSGHDHDFSSPELERYLGAALLTASPGSSVNLRNPQVDVPITINDDRLQLIRERHPAVGGYPLGVQGQALALVSGGYDSPVAAWRMMRRGIKTHFLFFNLGGPAHEAGVHDVISYLWRRYGASHHVYFVSVPFEAVVADIQRQVPDGLMSVVLKRLMVQAASQLAQQAKIPALITGDALAQVSSQTLANLSVIDRASHLPILRPLIADDKQAIIDTARTLGTASFAEHMPEYCGATSKRPQVNAKPGDVEAAEAQLTSGILAAALENAVTTRVDKLVTDTHTHATRRPALYQPPTVTFDTLAECQAPCIIDIRPASESETSPLVVANADVLTIPFFDLAERLAKLPDGRDYLLYCENGVMSRLQAAHLADQGYPGIGIFTY